MPTNKKSKSKKTRKPKVTKTVTPEVVETPVVKETATKTSTLTTPTTPTLGEAFGELLAQLQGLRSQLTSVTSQVRTLQKRSVGHPGDRPSGRQHAQ